MIKLIKATKEHFDQVVTLRYEMLKDVNGILNESFNDDFKAATEKFFTEGDQTTFLALDENELVGCGTICYLPLMPTYSHPTGKRGHIMNVYTRKAYRRQGVAYRLMGELLKDAKEKGISHLSLDATKEGRYLYEKFGFSSTEEGMEINL